jgi:hypothetical protein
MMRITRKNVFPKYPFEVLFIGLIWFFTPSEHKSGSHHDCEVLFYFSLSNNRTLSLIL